MDYRKTIQAARIGIGHATGEQQVCSAADNAIIAGATVVLHALEAAIYSGLPAAAQVALRPLFASADRAAREALVAALTSQDSGTVTEATPAGGAAPVAAPDAAPAVALGSRGVKRGVPLA